MVDVRLGAVVLVFEVAPVADDGPYRLWEVFPRDAAADAAERGLVFIPTPCRRSWRASLAQPSATFSSLSCSPGSLSSSASASSTDSCGDSFPKCEELLPLNVVGGHVSCLLALVAFGDAGALPSDDFRFKPPNRPGR